MKKAINLLNEWKKQQRQTNSKSPSNLFLPSICSNNYSDIPFVLLGNCIIVQLYNCAYYLTISVYLSRKSVQ